MTPLIASILLAQTLPQGGVPLIVTPSTEANPPRTIGDEDQDIRCLIYYSLLRRANKMVGKTTPREAERYYYGKIIGRKDQSIFEKAKSALASAKQQAAEELPRCERELSDAEIVISVLGAEL